MTLTLPGGITLHPKALPGGPDPQSLSEVQDDQSALFPFQYALAVPDTMTSATLTIHVPAMPAVAAYSGDSPETVTPGTATFSFSVPAPSTPVPPADAASAPAAIPASSTGAPTSTSSSGASIAFIVAVAVALVALVVAVARRRRRPTPVVSAASGSFVPEPPPPSDRRRDDSTPQGPPRDATSVPPPCPVAGDGASPIVEDTGAQAPPTPPPAGTGPVDGDKPSTTTADDRAASPNPAVLVPMPGDAPERPAGEMWVRVLGRIDLDGWPAAEPRPGVTPLELLTFLALHPGRDYTAEELRDAVCGSRPRDISADSVGRYINDLRRALGRRAGTRDSPRGGYQLHGVTTDAAIFDRCLARARSAPDAAGRAGHLVAAMQLVRGAPFASSPSPAFGWTTIGEQLASTLTNRVHSVALELADLAVEAGDPALAEFAVSRGRLVSDSDEALDFRASEQPP